MVNLSLLSEVSLPTGKDVDIGGATPTPRLATGRWLFGTGGLWRGVRFNRSGRENPPITIPQISRQVDAVDQDVAIFGAMSVS